MLKSKNTKKGFTIVELVIVISVIAVLSAVLIPTFVSLVKKAKKSADMTTVANINRVLAAGEVTNGKPKTYTEMLAIAEEGGFVIDKLSPTSDGHDFVWDKNTNKVYLYDEDGKFVKNQSVKEPSDKTNYWYLVDSAEDATTAGKNVYLSNASVTDVTVDAGIEVAGATNVTLDTDAAGTFDICLNGGNLTIDAPNADVNSYGKKGEVTIVAVKGASYHENGKAAFLKLQQGHVVIEGSAYVETIYKTSATATVEKASNATVVNALADSDANKTNGSSGLVFEATTKTESTLKTEAKTNLETHDKVEEGYVVKTSKGYYKTIAEAMKDSSKLMYLIADSDEDVSLKNLKVLIVNDGVNYTGTVSNVGVEVVSDLKTYVYSLENAWTYYSYFSPETKAVTIKLLSDVTYSKQQATVHGTALTLDLNGKTITSNLSSTSFLFLVKDNFTLTSSVAGAKVELVDDGLAQVSSDYTSSIVNISNIAVNKSVNSSKELILNYATVNIANSTINVVGSSSKVFNLYGDLTLGEGTVVNVSSVLGSSFLSVNGAANIVIDGAEINVAEFKVNGGSFLSLSSNNSLTIKDSSLEIGVNETYGSYFVNNVRPQNLTIEISDLTTEITGLTSGSTYTIDAETAKWSKN